MTVEGIERRIVSVLFCDLVGFTALSEALDAEDVATVQEAYFAAVRDAVGRYTGRLEKFIGDAAVAVFGTPATRDDDAERAVRCAFAIIGGVEQVCARLGMEVGTLRVRVSVNTGEAVVHPGAGPGEAVVTGDTINTAARLQSAAPPDGVLVGATTALAIADVIDVEDAGALDLKGKADPFPSFHAIAVRPVRSRDAAMGSLRAPMLGRDAELASLLAGLEAIAGGGAHRISIVAPPGVGKTRLTTEFTSAAAARGASIRRARLRPDVLAPYDAVAELFAAAIADVSSGPGSDADAAADALDRALRERDVPEPRISVIVADTLGVAWPERARPSTDTPEHRDALFASWRAALGALGEGPEVWLVEDVHWAGGDLLAFLDVAGADDADRRGRLIVTTGRPSLLESAPSWLGAADVLHLASLAPADAAALIDALVGDAIPPSLAHEIADRSDGNALFIEELLRTWISTGVLVLDGPRWRLATAPSDVSLPETVQAIYAAQLDDLPTAARTTARAASVAGRRFPTSALDALGAAEHAAGLEVLERRALISGPTAEMPLGETWSFRHALLRDAGYASLARAERARLHVRMARWLEGAAGDRAGQVAEVIGRHYAAAVAAAPSLADDVGDGLSRAHATAAAATWFERGARAASAVGAHDAAAALLRRSLELTADGDVVDLARRQTALARAIAFVSDIDEALRLTTSAMDAIRAVSDDDIRDPEARMTFAAATWLRCRILGQQLRFHDIVEVADGALPALRSGDDAATARVLVARGLGRAMIGDAALRAYEADTLAHVLAIAARDGDRELELDARMWLSLEDETEDDWRRIADLATELGRLDAAGQALQVHSGFAMPDDPRTALARVETHRTFAVAHGLTEEQAWADYRESEVRFHLGEWDAASDAATRAVDIGIDNGYHRVTVRTWHVATLIADARGETDTLSRAVAWYDGFRAGAPDSPYGRLVQTQVDLIFARHGLGPEVDPSLEHLSASLGEGQTLPSWFGGVDLIVATWVERDELETANAAVEAFANGHRAPTMFGDAVTSLLHARVRGEARVARGAAEEFARLGTPWWAAKALRVIDRAGEASDRERTEAARIERDLGLSAPAW